MGKYTDRKQVHGNTVWYDLDYTYLVETVSEKSHNWLDFITGITMHRGAIEVNPNGTFSIYFRGNKN